MANNVDDYCREHPNKPYHIGLSIVAWGVNHHISPNAPIDLLGHSMGGNIAMIYAGTCPARIRRLVNVEGFGLARVTPSGAPGRLARWLSELKDPVSMRTFSSLQDVADHLLKRSPHMEEHFASWVSGAIRVKNSKRV